jgi:hypothetical protein
MAYFTGPNIVTDELKLALDAGSERSYAGSGTTAYNIIDNSSVSLLNGVGFNSSNGGFWEFDGTDDYIQIPNAASLEPQNELSIEMVIKAQSIKTGWSILYGKNPYVNNGALVFLETGGQKIRALHYVGSTEYRCNPNVTISTSAWIHVVFTFKTGDAIRSYFNGVASTTIGLPAGTFSYGNYPYLVGHAGSSWPNINCAIVRSYAKALSAAEVLQNFNAQKSRFGL